MTDDFLTFVDYDATTHSTWLSSNNMEVDFIRSAMGIFGEAGEVAEKVKKLLRGDSGDFTVEGMDEKTKTAVMLELGDALYYISRLAKIMGFDLQAVADMNISKLASRQARGVIKGSGDER